MNVIHSKEAIKAQIVDFMRAEGCKPGDGRRLSKIAMWYGGPYPSEENGTDVMFADAIRELESEGFHIAEAMGGAFVYLVVAEPEDDCHMCDGRGVADNANHPCGWCNGTGVCAPAEPPC